MSWEFGARIVLRGQDVLYVLLHDEAVTIVFRNGERQTLPLHAIKGTRFYPRPSRGVTIPSTAPTAEEATISPSCDLNSMRPPEGEGSSRQDAACMTMGFSRPRRYILNIFFIAKRIVGKFRHPRNPSNFKGGAA